MEGEGAVKISDYYCHICKDLWLEPVTLPCQHTMCKECYFQNEASNPLQCPFCKKSVRSWTRKAKKANNYVDDGLWEKTRRLFADEVKKRIEGESIEIPDKELDFSYVQSRQHYGDGELRKEYERERRRQEAEMEAKRKMEEDASSDLLQSLQKEEEEVRRKEEERKRQEEEDAKFAALLSSQKSPSKFPVPKATRSKSKATPPVPKDQPVLTAAMLTTPKRKLYSASKTSPTSSVNFASPSSSPSTSKRTPHRPAGVASFASPSSSSPSTSQASLQRVVDAVNDRLREDSSSPESSIVFDLTPKALRRPAIKRREKLNVFDSSDEDDDPEDVSAADPSLTATLTKDSSPTASAAAAAAAAAVIDNPEEDFSEIAEKTLEGSDVNGNLYLEPLKGSKGKGPLKGSKGKRPLKTKKGSGSQSPVKSSSRQKLPAEDDSPILASNPKILESAGSSNSLSDLISDPVSKNDSALKPKSAPNPKSKNGKSKPAYVFGASDSEDEEEEEEERVSSKSEANDDGDDNDKHDGNHDRNGYDNDGVSYKPTGKERIIKENQTNANNDSGSSTTFTGSPDNSHSLVGKRVVANDSSRNDSALVALGASSSSSSAASSSSSSSAVTPDASFIDPDMVEDQTRIEEELRRARDQEEADRKMALKLQRLFQKEQYEELTKRPEGYGTRAARSSRSPLPKYSDDADVSSLSKSPRRSSEKQQHEQQQQQQHEQQSERSAERRGASSGKAKTKSRQESPSSPSRSHSHRGSVSTPTKVGSLSRSTSSQSKISTPPKSQTPSQSSVKTHFSKASSSSFSRSRSLAIVNQNKPAYSVDGKRSSSIERSSSADDESRTSVSSCPHRSSQGSENCSFCILTSPKSGKGSATGASQAASSSSSSRGSGKGNGKGLKRKTESPNLASKSKKRKDSST